MQQNLLIIAAAAFFPLALGMVWYGPLFGKAWMQASGLTEEKAKSGNMFITMGIVYLLSFFLGFALQFNVIHQYHLFSMLMMDKELMNPASDLVKEVSGLMAKYGNDFRTFKHGALHGTITGVMLALPIVATSALFEKRGFKYIAIHTGYWIITLAVMGGIICQFCSKTIM